MQALTRLQAYQPLHWGKEWVWMEMNCWRRIFSAVAVVTAGERAALGRLGCDTCQGGYLEMVVRISVG